MYTCARTHTAPATADTHLNRQTRDKHTAIKHTASHRHSLVCSGLTAATRGVGDVPVAEKEMRGCASPLRRQAGGQAEGDSERCMPDLHASQQLQGLSRSS